MSSRLEGTQGKDADPRTLCDHICLLDDGHVERGEPHFYGYELPSPRLVELEEERDAWKARSRELSRLRDKESAKKQRVWDEKSALEDRLRDRDAMKNAVCLYLMQVNADMGGRRGRDEAPGRQFIAPTAIDWLGDGIVSAIVGALAE